MGCLVSRPKDGGENKTPADLGEMAVFVPGLRIPKTVDFSQSFGEHLPRNLVERLSALRAQIILMVGREVLTAKLRRKTATQHGGSSFSDLLKAIENYLSVFQGVVKEGSQLKHLVQFVWVNEEDSAKETAISNAWYEILSLLHLMAMLSLSQANSLLTPKMISENYQPQVPKESRRDAIDAFLKAAGYLDHALEYVLPQMHLDLRRHLPLDLSEGVLRALLLQALGQGVDIQLGMAIDSTNATLAVKRRLACEMLKCWNQAQDSIMNLPLINGWGEKHQIFLKWKYAEAKAAAYYYHALILDEGNSEISHRMAVASLQAAEEFLKESKKAREAFSNSPPISRNPPLWGTSKYLHEKIPEVISDEFCDKDPPSHETMLETVPVLPDFALALKPEEYRLPPVDPAWNNLV